MTPRNIFAVAVTIIALLAILVMSSKGPENNNQTTIPSEAPPLVQDTEPQTPPQQLPPVAVTPPAKNNSLVSVLSKTHSAPTAPWKGLKNNAIRSSPVMLPPALLSQDTLAKGEEISLELFDDVQVQAIVTTSKYNVNGTVSTTARIKGSEYGRVFVAQSGNEVRAKIIIPEQNKIYSINFNPLDYQYYALELDPATEEPDDVGPHRYAPSRGTTESDKPKMQSEESASTGVSSLQAVATDETVASVVVDILVVYTNQAFSEVGSLTNMQNLIAIGMAMANDAHSNSSSGITFNLVHSEIINYTQSSSYDKGDYLDFITDTNDSVMDEVHAIRDNYGADFVSLMVGNGTASSGGGIAWILTNLSGSPAYAFSVVDENVFDGYTPSHEIGHNMGLAHAADQTLQPGPTGGDIGTDAAGWHWHPQVGETGYASIMSYDYGGYYADGLGHVKVGLFSDPNITHGGLKAGDIVLANNARVLRLLKNVYADYRTRNLSGTNILIEYPNQETVFTAGESYDINWNSINITGNVKIDIYQQGVFLSSIIGDTLDDRRYTWDIPADFSGEHFTIRVSSIVDPAQFDESDNPFEVHTAFFNDPLDSEPGNVVKTGVWEFGLWTKNTELYGGPNSTNTGVNIYDTDLDYVAFTTSTLTMGPIDCSDYKKVQLNFSGWYAIYSNYTAKVEYKNGLEGAWQDIYSRTGTFSFDAWTPFTFDISEYADNGEAVYLRWTYLNDGGSSAYAGMSLDDISLTGLLVPVPGDIDGDNDITLKDTILTLQLLTGDDVNVITSGDVNGDGLIGLPEAIYSIKKLATQ
ncbi:MAG: hypothetical protein ACI8ZB_003082 [Desulforhopalus sp.]|jgi:hypothetical protein